jgi:RNA polymerase sigma-70 factor (ECF subfamily)
MDDSDLSLLSRIRQGDSDALGIVLERHWPAVVRYASDILDSRDAAEDVAQETFVRLWERREAWRLEGSVRALLLRVTRNLSLDELRRRSARHKTARSAPQPPLRLLPDEELEHRELRSILTRAVDSLPERRREVFVLVRHYGLSYRETAAVLDLAPQTVANHLTLAVADLRRLLRPYLYDRGDPAADSRNDPAEDSSCRDRATDQPH